MTITILGIAGSLRGESFNRALLAAARHELPPGTEFAVWDDLAAVPPFDEDAEETPGEAVTGLRKAVAEAHAVLISTPEYNNSLPGQLKNALDWASRPYGACVLTGKPAAVIGASPGPRGAITAQADTRRVLTAAGARVVDEELGVGDAFRRFDERGRLLDHDLRTALADLLTALVRA
ncbi:MAG: NAD(P)H-dependent oxidoreductase [Saccharothrix sp.]|nr:NAD(P)H-dependent oxidoreductase [Saccharothrix sp.]